ncbi:unnamed protein product [Schistocephalus solidus]|uniref:Endo/exonuclease/phosphatase domain-containing protein n=1 Tax=Schistocephalus solidus TaxID=70667 RepID=A0A183SNH0_SCHSO|nr:unnamed protein product [Schistocephalus solidus]
MVIGSVGRPHHPHVTGPPAQADSPQIISEREVIAMADRLRADWIVLASRLRKHWLTKLRGLPELTPFTTKETIQKCQVIVFFFPHPRLNVWKDGPVILRHKKQAIIACVYNPPSYSGNQSQLCELFGKITEAPFDFKIIVGDFNLPEIDGHAKDLDKVELLNYFFAKHFTLETNPVHSIPLTSHELLTHIYFDPVAAEDFKVGTHTGE